MSITIHIVISQAIPTTVWERADLRKSMNNRRKESLGTVLEAAHHRNHSIKNVFITYEHYDLSQLKVGAWKLWPQEGGGQMNFLA